MSLWLKQSTARTIHIGPFVDDTDGKTAETGLTISQADVRLSKNGGDMAQKNDATSCTHDELGYYTCPLDTTDTNTLGHLKLMVHESGALPVFMDMMVVPANVWDSMFGSDKLQVDVEEIGAGMITAAAIATDAIDADAIKADAVTEIQSGLATSAEIAAIKAKTDTIGSLSVTITSPVATDGTVTIEQGDSYNGIVGGTLPISVLKSGIPYDLTGASARLKCDQATFGPVAITDDGTNWVATFEPTAAQTATLTMLSQSCEVEASWPDGKIKTYLRGTLRVNRDIPAVS